jgi:hypothetical protein
MVRRSCLLRPIPGEGKGRVLKLLHHLYGHPVAANAAQAKMWLDIVSKFGFEVVDLQGTMFVYKKDGKTMCMTTVVDDSVIANNNDALFDGFIAHFTVKCEVPIDVSELEHNCGMRVKWILSVV